MIDSHSLQAGHVNGNAVVDIGEASCWRMTLAFDREIAVIADNDGYGFGYLT